MDEEVSDTAKKLHPPRNTSSQSVKSIVPIDQSEKRDELRELQQKKLEQAVSNLVRGKTPKSAVMKRQARGGMSVDYVPGWYMVDQLNALFNYKWDFDIVEQGIFNNKQVWVKGKLIAHTSQGDIVKMAFGGSDIKTSKDGTVIDIGDDFKAAATDAMKKAATLFGIAADVYGKREKEEGEEPKKELKSGNGVLEACRRKAELLGIKLEDKVKEWYGKELKDLDSKMLFMLLQKLNKGA